MQNHTTMPTDAVACEPQGPLWLTELSPLEVCAFAGALVFVAYRFFCG